MARFFFNVFDGYSAIDTDGTDLPDWQDVRREAVRMAGLILINEGDRLRPGEGWTLEVTDEVGLVLVQLGVSLAETPTLERPRASLLPRR